jgi:predicted RNA-binding Zn-ribbon protein involved in translation (DUF1610 family)
MPLHPIDFLDPRDPRAEDPHECPECGAAAVRPTDRLRDGRVIAVECDECGWVDEDDSWEP